MVAVRKEHAHLEDSQEDRINHGLRTVAGTWSSDTFEIYRTCFVALATSALVKRLGAMHRARESKTVPAIKHEHAPAARPKQNWRRSFFWLATAVALERPTVAFIYDALGLADAVFGGRCHHIA